MTEVSLLLLHDVQEGRVGGRWLPKKTMEDLVHETFPIWKVNQQEDPEFMVPFIEMHRKWRAEQMGDLENKYDALGRPLADIEREMARQRKKVMDMEKEVEETVVKAKDRSGLNRYFNYLCKTDRGSTSPARGPWWSSAWRRGSAGAGRSSSPHWTASPRATSTGAPSTPGFLTTSAQSLRGSPLTTLRY